MNPPLSRYAGGKRHLLPQIMALMPKEFAGIHEPFAGGAALFWSLTSPEKPMPAILTDRNPYVAALYKGLKEDADGVATTIELFAEQEQLVGVDLGNLYNAVRDAANQMAHEQTHSASLAARVLWLNRRCFNGLMRVNRRGDLNVPMGKWKGAPPALPTRQEILDWGAALQNAEVRCGGPVNPPSAGWVHYADPPYWNGFTQYTAEGFGWNDQVRAANTADLFSRNGTHVICSNSDTPEIREIYEERGFTIHEVSRPGTINSDGAKRARVGELLMVKEAK